MQTEIERLGEKRNKNFQFDGKGYFLNQTKVMQQKYQINRQKIEESLKRLLMGLLNNSSLSTENLMFLIYSYDNNIVTF